MCAKDVSVTISGAAPLDLATIRKSTSPVVETPDPLVFAEPLKAEDIDYVVVYNHQDRPMSNTMVKVHVSGIRRVRDLSQHKDIPFRTVAETATISLNLDGYDGVFLALLREETKGVIIRAPLSTRRAEDIVTTIAIPGLEKTKGMAPLEIRVLNPTGTETWYGRTVTMSEGRVRYSIPIAENDPPGIWKIKVTELVCGNTASVAVTVR